MKERWKNLTETWLARLAIDRAYHEQQALSYNGLHMWLGIPTVIFAAATGTTVFAGLTDSDHLMYRIASGIVSLLASILAALQSFSGFAKKSQDHSSVASRIQKLCYELEFRKSFPPASKREATDVFDNLQRQFSDLPTSFPRKNNDRSSLAALKPAIWSAIAIGYAILVVLFVDVMIRTFGWLSLAIPLSIIAGLLTFQVTIRMSRRMVAHEYEGLKWLAEDGESVVNEMRAKWEQMELTDNALPTKEDN